MTIDEEMQLGRAKNTVLNFLEQRLSIPKIYIDANWNGHHVDVLAINRDGVGDVHAVLLFPCIKEETSENFVAHLTQAMNPLIDLFREISAQYKYIVAVLIGENGASALPGIPHEISDRSFSPDGLGRVGFLTVYSPVFKDDPKVEILFPPERFRAKIAKLADEYVQQHEADWEIRA